MSATIAACSCSAWASTDGVVRFCEEHHRYWRDAQELTSVTRVIKSTWPVKPDYASADADTLENARERGVAVDRLFTAYLRGQLSKIPAGTRQDAAELLQKLVPWWEGFSAGETRAQVVLSSPTEAGTCDVITVHGLIADLKCTYDIEAMYPVQLGGYADLYEAQYGHLPEVLGIIHLTKRFKEPQWIPLDVAACVRDYRLCRDTYRMAMGRVG